MSPEAYSPPAAEMSPGHNETVDADVGTAELERQHFALTLLEKGLISEEFYRSGALDKFYSDESVGKDALTHLFVGDEGGGIHHLSTLLALEIPGRTVASSLPGPESKKPLRHYRSNQRVRGNGAYHALYVEITGRNGDKFVKELGSAMFPNEWSTQKVLESIIQASEAPAEGDPMRQTSLHRAEVDGVKIKVSTDKKTGKIMAAFPG